VSSTPTDSVLIQTTSAPPTSVWTSRLRATSKSPEIPVVDTQLDDDILSSIPDPHSTNDCARDTRRSMDVESNAVCQDKRSNSSRGIRKRYESKVIRPLQNRRKEHDCIKEITDATVTMSSDKSTKECSSLLIPRSSDRSKQKTLDTVDCHSSSTVLLTPPTTQNKSRRSYTALVPAIRYSGEHINTTRSSGENIETKSQREPRVNLLSSSKRVSFANDTQPNVSESHSDSDNDICSPNLLPQSNHPLLSKQKSICSNSMAQSNHSNLSKRKPICTNISSKSNLNAKIVSSELVSNPIESNITCDNTGMIEGNLEDFKYLIGKIHKR
jgi:hypothetical protein